VVNRALGEAAKRLVQIYFEDDTNRRRKRPLIWWTQYALALLALPAFSYFVLFGHIYMQIAGAVGLLLVFPHLVFVTVRILVLRARLHRDGG